MVGHHQRQELPEAEHRRKQHYTLRPPQPVGKSVKSPRSPGFLPHFKGTSQQRTTQEINRISHNNLCVKREITALTGLKPKSQNTTSQFSHNNCNKFRIKSLKTKNYIQRHYVTVQPQKLVIPIATSFEYNIKRHTIPLHFRTTKQTSHTSSR